MDQADRGRMMCGAMTAGAGFVVAIVMRTAGGDLARFLPEAPGFHLVALAGAAVAGVAVADGFGRRGWLGLGLFLTAAPLATAVGAAFGASVLMTVLAAVQWFAGDADMANGVLTGAPVLGIIAMLDGVGTSPAVAATWGTSMLAVHFAMRRTRRTA